MILTTTNSIDGFSIAEYRGIGYQPLMRQILQRFAASEGRMIMRELLEKEKLRREREVFYRDAVAAYTPEVCRETLKLNEATPYVTE